MIRLALPFAVFLGIAVAAPFPSATGLGATAAMAKSKTKTKVVTAKDPESVIRNVYAQYSKEAGPAEAEQQTFSPDLLKLWYDVQGSANSADQVGVDFDVFLDAQDLDAVTGITSKFTPDGNSKGAVDITFTAFGKPKTVSYAMVKTGQGWKIDNISWGAAREDLRQTLAAIKGGKKAIQ
jgi:hypothetical protein